MHPLGDRGHADPRTTRRYDAARWTMQQCPCRTPHVSRSATGQPPTRGTSDARTCGHQRDRHRRRAGGALAAVPALTFFRAVAFLVVAFLVVAFLLGMAFLVVVCDAIDVCDVAVAAEAAAAGRAANPAAVTGIATMIATRRFIAFTSYRSPERVAHARCGKQHAVSAIPDREAVHCTAAAWLARHETEMRASRQPRDRSAQARLPRCP